MIPILHRPGEIIPGQFGPISREFFVFRYSHTFTMSSAGMPSVMHTISAMPASAASMIASAAPGGGTKITVAFAPVLATASLTVLKIGQPSWVVPPLPGVTPPITCVPYAAQAFAWKVPSRPVKPCTINRVLLSTKIAIIAHLRKNVVGRSSLVVGDLMLRSSLLPLPCRRRLSWFRLLRSSGPIPSGSFCLLQHWCLRVAAPPAVEGSFFWPPRPRRRPAYPLAE